MKHFEIGIFAENHMFTYVCTSAADAYDAIIDAAQTFMFEVNADELMGRLVDMKRDKFKTVGSERYQITYKDGEV